MNIDCNSLCDAQQGMQNNDMGACEKSEGILKYGCYTEIAKKTKNHEVCQKIDDPTMKDTCYISLAEEMKDVSICDKVESGMFKDVCRQSSKE